ncbi:MAG: hypothetical protein LBO82_03770 [Synergistaceae bacterium]|jgi:hypothetical protein|nr:hypothetical protein [Synergistaceae bacterium]
MKKGSFWLVLFALVFVVMAGGCGGGGGGGGGGTPGAADIFNGTWKSTDFEIVYDGEAYSGADATIVITPVSNNNAANTTTKHIRLTLYVSGNPIGPLEYKNVLFDVSNDAGYVTMEGYANTTDYLEISGKSSGFHLFISGEVRSTGSGSFTRTSSGYALTTESESEAESEAADSVNDLIIDLKEKLDSQASGKQ